MKCSECGFDEKIVVISITDKNGSLEFCPNCLIKQFIENELSFENHPDFVDDVTGEKGAVKFESYDEVYVLEKERMLRLISHNLEPEEYFALAEKYGANKYMIHEDFYDEIDGEALQPVILD